MTTHPSFGWCTWHAFWEREDLANCYSVFGADYFITLHLLVMLMLPGVCMQVPQALRELSEQSEVLHEGLSWVAPILLSSDF